MAIGNKYTALSAALSKAAGTARDTGNAFMDLYQNRKKKRGQESVAEGVRAGLPLSDVAATAFETDNANLGLPILQQSEANKQANIAREDTQKEKATAAKEKAALSAEEFAASKTGFDSLMQGIDSAVTDPNDKAVLAGIKKRAEQSAKSKDDFAKLTQEALDIYATGRDRGVREKENALKKEEKTDNEKKAKEGFLSSVDILLSQSKKAPAQGEGVIGRLSGKASGVAGKIGLAPEYELLDNYASALAGPAARTIMQEKGNMAEGDVTRMLAMFPKAGDTKKERAHKEKVLQSLSDVIKGTLSSDEFKKMLYADVDKDGKGKAGADTSKGMGMSQPKPAAKPKRSSKEIRAELDALRAQND